MAPCDVNSKFVNWLKCTVMVVDGCGWVHAGRTFRPARRSVDRAPAGGFLPLAAFCFTFSLAVFTAPLRWGEIDPRAGWPSPPHPDTANAPATSRLALRAVVMNWRRFIGFRPFFRAINLRWSDADRRVLPLPSKTRMETRQGASSLEDYPPGHLRRRARDPAVRATGGLQSGL